MRERTGLRYSLHMTNTPPGVQKANSSNDKEATMKATMKILSALIALVATLVSAGTLQVHAQANDPASVISAAQAQVNAGNIDGLMSFFAEDATVTNDGTVYSGKAKVREFMQSALDDHIQATTVGAYHVAGNKVTWRERITADSLRQIGVASIYTNNAAVVENGLITSIVFTTDPESIAEIERAMAAAPSGMPSTGSTNLLSLVALAVVGTIMLITVGSTLRRKVGTSR